jgi:hypothetical protein
MNFTQMHERLRLEFQRRVQRGTSSISLLSRQTGFGKSHLSSFLHARGQLSLDALDRVLASLQLSLEELVQYGVHSTHASEEGTATRVPLVSHNAALFEPIIRPAAAQTHLQLPRSLQALKTKPVSSRRSWHRFVAIMVDDSDVGPMSPLLPPNAIVVIDRHYNSLRYREGKPLLFAVHKGPHLAVRYADYLAARLVLRPLNLAYPIDLIEIGSETSPGQLIAGRVAFILSELST